MSAHTIPIGATAEHDAALRALKSLVQKIFPDEAANAFLYSLSTRTLEYRAVLGSYWYAAAIPEHTPTDTWHCYECGWSREKTSGFGKNPAEVLRTLSMLRTSEGKSSHKLLLSALTDFHTRNGQPDFGCVHTSLHQCLLVLDHFLSLPPVRHTEQDEELLQQILQCIYALEPHQRGRALQKKITQSRIIKSNAWEIDNLLNALGICGILSSDRAPCYAEEFCDEYQRSPETDSELLYPLNWWRACDGINKKRYEIVFGKPFHGPVSIV